MSETKEPDWADEFAELTFGHWNPRFVLYRNQDPTFRQDDIGRLAAVLRRAEQRGYERGIGLLSDALEAVAETEKSCRLFVDLKMATDQRCNELTESNIERGKRIAELEQENAELVATLVEKEKPE